jgi:hypothetical protein
VDQCAFNIACMATVHDTNYEYFAQDDFRVRKPDIKIKVGGILFYLQVHATLKDGESTNLPHSFSNCYSFQIYASRGNSVLLG